MKSKIHHRGTENAEKNYDYTGRHSRESENPVLSHQGTKMKLFFAALLCLAFAGCGESPDVRQYFDFDAYQAFEGHRNFSVKAYEAPSGNIFWLIIVGEPELNGLVKNINLRPLPSGGTSEVYGHVQADFNPKDFSGGFPQGYTPDPKQPQSAGGRYFLLSEFIVHFEERCASVKDLRTETERLVHSGLLIYFGKDWSIQYVELGNPPADCEEKYDDLDPLYGKPEHQIEFAHYIYEWVKPEIEKAKRVAEKRLTAD